MGFRSLPPQRRQDIGRSHAGPHNRFGKRRGDRLTISCLFAAIAEVGSPFPLRTSGRFYRQFRLVTRITREHRPDDSRVLVGKRHRRNVCMSPMSQFSEPKTSWILFAASSRQGSTGTVDHQRAQVTITALTDANQAGSSSAGSLFGYQAKPGRELATILEAGSVTNGCDQCRCRNRTDSFDLSEALAGLAVAEHLAYPAIVGCNSPIQFSQFLPQLHHERTDQR